MRSNRADIAGTPPMEEQVKIAWPWPILHWRCKSGTINAWRMQKTAAPLAKVLRTTGRATVVGCPYCRACYKEKLFFVPDPPLAGRQCTSARRARLFAVPVV